MKAVVFQEDVETEMLEAALGCGRQLVDKSTAPHPLPRRYAMNSLILEIPGDALPFPADPPESFADEARFLLAIKLFELGRITSGKAGKLCNMGRVEFLLAAGRAGVPLINLNADEADRELMWP